MKKKIFLLIPALTLLWVGQGWADIFQCPLASKYEPGHQGKNYWVAPPTPTNPEFTLKGPSSELWIKSVEECQLVEVNPSDNKEPSERKMACTNKVTLSDGTQTNVKSNSASIGNYTYCFKGALNCSLDCYNP